MKSLGKNLKSQFTNSQHLRRIEEKLKDRLPTREDFSELKSIVQELAQSQH